MTGRDVARFGDLLEEQLPGRWDDAEAFMDSVQTDFAELVGQSAGDAVAATVLRQLCHHAAVQAAADITEMVGEAHVAAQQQERLSNIFEGVVTEQLEAAHRAEHDPLTGLLNRAGFERRVNDLMADAPATKVPVALAFFDCDGFKATNDRHGHDAGDALLTGIVSRIRASVRDSDLICRWGGDELVILFLGLSEEGFVEVAASTRDRVMREPITWQGIELTPSITAGLVWADAVTPEFEVSDLVTQADVNLYVAKRHRRGSLSFRGRPLPLTTHPNEAAPCAGRGPAGAE